MKETERRSVPSRLVLVARAGSPSPDRHSSVRMRLTRPLVRPVSGRVVGTEIADLPLLDLCQGPGDLEGSGRAVGFFDFEHFVPLSIGNPLGLPACNGIGPGVRPCKTRLTPVRFCLQNLAELQLRPPGGLPVREKRNK